MNLDLVRSFEPARALLTAVELDVFTRLDERPLALADLASAIGASERGTAALAAALMDLGLVERRPDGAFAAVPEAARALSRRSADWRGAVAFQANDLWKRFSALTDCVRTGAPPAFPARSAQDVIAATLAVHHATVDRADAIAALLPLGGKKRLLDLGGGPGTIAAALLRAHPDATATIVDLPHALDVAKKLLPKEWIAAGRVRLKAQNLLEDVPPAGFDLALLSDVLSHFDPAEARRILLRAREALVPGGALAIRDAFEGGPRAGLRALGLLVETAAGRPLRREEALEWVAALGFTEPRWARAEGDPEREILLAARP